jgi:D-serine deaminase-like pyridoxal phosphate-dependent protein
MSAPAPSLDTIVTPGLVLERGRLEQNLARVAKLVAGRGVRLRPHMKTAKSIDVARLAAPDLGGPIAVSTLLEAEYFFSHGYRDIFYPVGLGPGKLARAMKLVRSGAKLIVNVDSLTAARALVTAADAEKIQFRVAIEIDCGDRRGGIAPDDPSLVPIARELGPHFVGVATHGGQSYDGRTPEDMARYGETEADALRTAVARLTAEGIACPLVSVGSSPTALTSNSLHGITEMRAGVYMFGDLFQAGIGTCKVDDIAASVLTEVIGRPAGRNALLIDAGAFALSKDMATAGLPPALQAGYGWVCDLDGRLLAGLKVARVWQEHGMIVSDQPLPPEIFPVGRRLRILPNHACPTAAAHGAYHVVDGSRDVTAVWLRVNGW